VSDTQALAVADATVGAVLIAAGAVSWRLRPKSRTGIIMVATGVCWFAGSIISAAVYLHRGPLVQLQLSYPTGRLRRATASAVVALAYGTALFVALARNSLLTLALATLVGVAAIDGFARTSGPARKAGGPALASALVFASVLALSSAGHLLDWHADIAVLLAYDATVLFVAVVLLADLVWGGWTDATLTDLVTDLGQREDTEGLPGQLQRALGDPSLAVGFWLPEQDRYVDDLGRPLDVPVEDGLRTVTRIDDQGQPLAVLIHDAAVLDDPHLVDGVASAARLTVANARMRAAVRVRVGELSASRRRLVEAGDAQRRQLQLELELGAEKRIGDVERLLDGLQAKAATGAAQQLWDVRVELGSARVELREFAQGIRPSALSDGGLPAAIPLLAERSSVPVTLTVDIDRLSPPIEAAIFFLCSEALANVAKHARATSASVELRIDGRDVLTIVADNGVGGADARGSGLRGLADRVEALGGTLAISDATDGGTRLVARIPAPFEDSTEGV
jgi:hypothetical protein